MVERGNKKPISTPSVKFSRGKGKDKTSKEDKYKSSDEKHPRPKRTFKFRRKPNDKKMYTIEYTSGKYHLEPVKETEETETSTSSEEEESKEVEPLEEIKEFPTYYDTVYSGKDEGLFTIEGYDIESKDPVEYVIAKEFETYVFDLEQANIVEHTTETHTSATYDNKELSILEELNNLYFKACNTISNFETKKGAYQKQYNKQYSPGNKRLDG